MSLSTAARTAPAARRHVQPRHQRPQLRLVEAGRRGVSRQVSRVPFPVVCATLLMLGLLAVLVLNVTISQSSFALVRLQERAATLDDQAMALRHDIDAVSSSGHLAQEADKLGMAPAAAPMFLDPETGKVTGSSDTKGRAASFAVVSGRAAAAPMKAPAPAAADAASQVSGLSLGGGLFGAVASLSAK